MESRRDDLLLLALNLFRGQCSTPLGLWFPCVYFPALRTGLFWFNPFGINYKHGRDIVYSL